MSELCDLSAVELRRRIGCKDVSPVELLDSCIDRIEAVNGTLNGDGLDLLSGLADEAKGR